MVNAIAKFILLKNLDQTKSRYGNVINIKVIIAKDVNAYEK